MGGIDRKYGTITTERENTPFHPNEPVFLIRAQDRCAVETVLAYAELASEQGAPEELVAGAQAAADGIAQWQNDNPNLVKTPD